MAEAKLSEADFIARFEEIGPHALAKELGIAPANVFRRRNRLERKIGRQITGPDHPNRRRAYIAHPHRLMLDVSHGTVIVGSDFHYWPGEPSTGHRAFVHFIKTLKPAVVILNGDVFDGASISRHPPIGWAKNPTVQEEIETCQDRLDEIAKACPKKSRKIWNLGNHDCLDAETECLTKRGWLRYSEIQQSDEILSLVNDRAVWSHLDEIVTFPYNGELIRVEKTRASMAVTPNHRVLLRRFNWRSKRLDILEYRRADDLPYSFDVPTAGDSDAAGVDLTDDQLTLAGWLLTDGHYSTSNLSIFQSKAAEVEHIGALLDRMGLAYSRYERQRERRPVCGRELLKDPLPSYQFLIRAKDSRWIREWLPRKGSLPAWAHDLNSRQFQILLDALVAGDGIWDGYCPEGKTCCVIYGTEEILSSIQAVAVCHGWRARLAIDNRGDFRLCLTREPKIRIERPEVFTKHYEGVVWCLRVPHGNFMVRRNGCAYFTGNSRFETRIATVAPEYAKVVGVALHDHFPLWERAWAAWINDDVVVKHRFKGGIHATHNNTIWAGKTMVTGHLHSAKVTPFTDYNGTRYGVDTGCIADTFGDQFRDYTEDNPRNWRSAFAVLNFRQGQLLMPELVLVWDRDHVQWRGDLVKV